MRRDWVSLALLWVQAEALVLTGALITAGGADRVDGPAFAYMDFLPWWPNAWAAWAVSAGALIAAGLTRWHPRLVRAGLVLAGLWYGFATACFTRAAIHKGTPLYPIAVYACLTSIVVVLLGVMLYEARERSALRQEILASREALETRRTPPPAE